MFEMKGKLDLAKRKMFRLFPGLRRGDFDASSSTWANKDLRQLNTFNPQAKILANQRRLEIELQKTVAIWTVRMIRARECH
jgi:hypothetical protein